ncbi:hypothetical protein BY996DRAFT_6556758 [Phakopsora pachyrhizi]|nr:hypothetical protein BY996DRAFT_6556758 [Phakopsora pachyrhizi]
MSKFLGGRAEPETGLARRKKDWFGMGWVVRARIGWVGRARQGWVGMARMG